MEQARPEHPPSRKPWAWVVAAGFALVALWYWTDGLGGAPHRLDRSRPFRIEFGRGSGWHGLNTVAVESGGTATLHRLGDRQWAGAPVWETATLRLSPDNLAAVLDAVEGNHLLGMRRMYSSGANDGTQWVLWVRQGGYEKAVYFDNEFPRRIERFAEELDRVLAAAGADTADWRPVPAAVARQHERALWDSIYR